MPSTTQNFPLPSFIPTGRTFTVWTVVALAVGLAAAWHLGNIGFEMTGAEAAFLGLPVALLVLVCVWHNEKLWIYSAVLGEAFNLLGGGEGITAGDVAFGVWVIGGVALWLGKELLVYRRPIIRSSFDFLFISFFLLSSLLSVITFTINGGMVSRFFTEWLSVANLLLYFPVRSILNKREDVIQLLILFSIIALFNSLFAITMYKKKMLTAVVEAELMTTRSVSHENVAMAWMLICATVFGYTRSLRLGMLALCGMGLGFVGLLISLSRGPILSGLGALVMMLFLVSGAVRKRLLIAICAMLLGGIGLGYAMFPEAIETIGAGIMKRMATVNQASSDRSLQSRAREQAAALKYIERSPLIGYGYGVLYHYYDNAPGRRGTIYSSFFHNGWLWPFYKFGIPLGLFFLLMYFYPTARLMLRYPPSSDTFLRSAAVCGLCFFVASSLTNTTSNQVCEFSGTFTILIFWAVLDFVNRSMTAAQLPQATTERLPAQPPDDSMPNASAVTGSI